MTYTDSAVTPGRPLSKRLYRLTRKLHMYGGLVIYAQLTLYGIAGLVATFEHAPEERAPGRVEVRQVEYVPPPDASDKEIADDLHALIDPPLAGPVPEWALGRDESGSLPVAFYSVNGPTRVEVPPGGGVLRVEYARNTLPRFLTNLHAITFRDGPADWRLRAWVILNELGIWLLLALAVSGVYLWLASRPRLTFALASSLAGAGAFLALWIVFR